MVELFEQNIRTQARQSSKGNQLKWENDNIWYKADYTGYEGLAEYMISHLLMKSSLQDAEYVLYEPEQIQYKSQIYQGVKSNSFLSDDWQIVTLERLFKTICNESLTSMVWRIPEVEDRLKFLTDQVERITGLQEFGVYLNKLFTIDAIFLNEDRHMHNIAVMMNGKGEFDYCPIFDNGGALLTDTTMDYPLDQDELLVMKEVHAKTISSDFDEQLDASEHFYGRNLRFSFKKKDVELLLTKPELNMYDVQIGTRVANILYLQMDKYKYLFY